MMQRKETPEHQVRSHCSHTNKCSIVHNELLSLEIVVIVSKRVCETVVLPHLGNLDFQDSPDLLLTQEDKLLLFLVILLVQKTQVDLIILCLLSVQDTL